MDLLDFHSTYRHIFAVHLKHYCFWPLANAKFNRNDLVYAMPWLCMFALTMCMLRSIWIYMVFKVAITYNNFSREALLKEMAQYS
jgi:hypothetical protein